MFREWFESEKVPFSFLYDGERVDGEAFAPVRVEAQPAREGVREKTLHYALPGLEFSVALRVYEGFDAAEWLLRLRNTGEEKSGRIQSVQVLDWATECAEHSWLHYMKGSDHSIDDFTPYDIDFCRYPVFAFASEGGRSSSGHMPYFSVEMEGWKRGFLGAIGWSGQWKSAFRNECGKLRTCVGMERTDFRLDPGESVRMPSMLLLAWEGDEEDGYNRFRRLLFAHYVPRIDGKPLRGPITASGWGASPADEHLRVIEKLAQSGAGFDAYWIDAGWYGEDEASGKPESEGVWWYGVGEWVANRKTYPNGLLEVGQKAEENGLRFLLWFESERAMYGTKPTLAHPEWYIGEKQEGKAVLLNIGDPDACRYITDTIASVLLENQIRFYRQDYNIDPYELWLSNDTPERIGLTEAHYIEGLYAFWDGLLARVPGLRIDNCASGGRRLDIETTKRSMPLWRSDYQCFDECRNEGMQFHSAMLSRWVPLSATRASHRPLDTYDFRSGMWAGINANYHPYYDRPGVVEWQNARFAECRRFQEYLDGDLYLLSAPSFSRKDWFAYQLNKPEAGTGVMLFFRRAESPYERAVFALRGIEAESAYSLEDADTGATETVRGADLLRYVVAFEEPYRCRMVYYRKNI